MPKRKGNTKSKGENGSEKKQKTALNSDAQNAIHSSRDEEPWSKSKKKRMRRLMARQNRNPSQYNQSNKSKANTKQRSQELKGSSSSNKQQEEKDAENNVPQLQSLTNKPLSALQQKFLSRLSGSRFRELNEELYTTNSESAFKRFQENPELFEQYHEGFRTQVKSWPVNPVDVICKWVISFYHKKKKEMKEKNQKQLRIADFGCGDAKLAEKLLNFQPKLNKSKKGPDNLDTGDSSNNNSKCPFKVHSFDLVANGNKLITPCDMKCVPLKNSSIDVGLFVLALMGTNIADFIREAHRVLTPNGVLKIAEVRSRFESTTVDSEDVGEGSEGNKKSKGNVKKKKAKQNSNFSKKQLDDSILNDFLDVMEQLGFKSVKMDRQNKMFIILEFEKTGVSPCKKASFTAKPCIYKRR